MSERQVDVAIIGAGTAGLGAQREAARSGRSWVLIDPGPFGTTCARVGCMPSKLLIAAADVAHTVAHAERFGVSAREGVAIDGPAVMRRVRSERDRFVGFVLDAVEAFDPANVLVGRGRICGVGRIEVDTGDVVQARTIVVATGSSTWIPPSLDPVRDRVLLNRDLFDLEDLPRSVAVVGTGVIALELGQALHRLGVRVTFLNPFDEVGGASDPVVSRSIREVFDAELDIQAPAVDLVFRRRDDGVEAEWRDSAGVERRSEFEWVLPAAGRRPNLAGLGFDSLPVELDERGAPTFDRQTTQVGDLPVFIAGDVNGDRSLLHEATDEGRIAGLNASSWPELRAHTRRTPLAIAFTDPNIAFVGKRFSELDPESVTVGEVSYANQGRARVVGQNRGVVRVYVDNASGRLLGAEMFGPSVEHTAHLLAWAVAESMTVQRALQMPFYHPVVEEGIRTALRDAAYKLRLERAPCASGLECGPGS